MKDSCAEQFPRNNVESGNACAFSHPEEHYSTLSKKELRRMRTKILFLDIIPDRIPGPEEDLHRLKKNQLPQLLTIAWQLMFEEERSVMMKSTSIVNPEKYASLILASTGNAPEVNIRKVKPLKRAMISLCRAMREVDIVVAHGFDYVSELVLETSRSIGVTCPILEISGFCTMENGRDICQIAPTNDEMISEGGYSRPSLSELYGHLTGERMTSMYSPDLRLDSLVRCYYEMVSRYPECRSAGVLHGSDFLCKFV